MPFEQLRAASSQTTAVNIPIGDVGFIGPSFNNTLSTANSFDWNISREGLSCVAAWRG